MSVTIYNFKEYAVVLHLLLKEAQFLGIKIPYNSKSYCSIPSCLQKEVELPGNVDR